MKKTTPEKPDGKVHVVRLALVGVDGDDFAAVKSRLRQESAAQRRVSNSYLNHWLRLHLNAGNHFVVREWMDADRTWARTPKNERSGSRVYCPIQASDSDMSKTIYAELRREFPEMATRPLTLNINKTQKSLKSKSAERSAYPQWMMTLCGDGGLPQSVGDHPIPFDKANARIVVPQNDNDPWLLEVKLVQAVGEGGGLQAWRFVIKTRGKGLHSIRNALWRLTDGTWDLRGSDLIFRRGLLYAHVVCRLPAEEKGAIDADKTAVLTFGRKWPIVFRQDGWTVCRMRGAMLISQVRRKLIFGKMTRHESYHTGSTSRRTHGTGRALSWQEPMRRRWLDFVRTWNKQLAAEIVRRMVDKETGKLVIYQPSEAWRDSRCLSNEGKVDGRREASSWDWYGLVAQVNRKCSEKGIEVVVRKGGERRILESKNAGKPNRKKSSG